MKKSIILSFVLSACLLASCGKEEVRTKTPFDAGARMEASRNYATHLTSAEEVRTPAVESQSQGQGLLKFNKEGTEVYYKLNVANLTNPILAHLHLGAARTNGGVVLDFMLTPVQGTVNGTLVEGTFTATNLSGALAGRTLEDFRNALEEGLIYFNVHTTANPGGEIRGQVD